MIMTQERMILKGKLSWREGRVCSTVLAGRAAD
jgi:hypothetical protein